MIKPEEVMNMRSLKKQAYSNRAIARMTGLDKRTVKKYLKEGEIPIYKKVIRQSKLESFKPLIEGWLSQENYQVSRIYELFLCEGFKRLYDIVQRHITKIPTNKREQRPF